MQSLDSLAAGGENGDFSVSGILRGSIQQFRALIPIYDVTFALLKASYLRIRFVREGVGRRFGVFGARPEYAITSIFLMRTRHRRLLRPAKTTRYDDSNNRVAHPRFPCSFDQDLEAELG